MRDVHSRSSEGSTGMRWNKCFDSDLEKPCLRLSEYSLYSLYNIVLASLVRVINILLSFSTQAWQCPVLRL